MKVKAMLLSLFVVILLSIFLLGSAHATLVSGGISGDDQTSIFYNAYTGELAVDAPLGLELTSIQITSVVGIFTGDPPQNLEGSFDSDTDNAIFKATFGDSFGSLSFGNVAGVGFSEAFILGDISVVGSLEIGGGLGDVDLIYLSRDNTPVPEPATMILLGTGLVGIVAFDRKKRLKK